LKTVFQSGVGNYAGKFDGLKMDIHESAGQLERFMRLA
jgi:hypothetical protein